MQAKKRIEKLLAIVNGDSAALNFIQIVMAKACAYVDQVFSIEKAILVEQLKPEGRDLEQLIENMESLRRIAYNDLVDSIKRANLYLFQSFGGVVPKGGGYSEDPSHLTDDTCRVEIENWAGELVISYFAGREKAEE